MDKLRVKQLAYEVIGHARIAEIELDFADSAVSRRNVKGAIAAIMATAREIDDMANEGS